jgi:hypothetical protein
VLIAMLAGCGSDGGGGGGGKPRLAWDGTPIVRASPSGARVVTGKVRNDSSSELRITAPKLRVVDANGHRIKSSAVFVSTYVRSIYPHNGITPARPSDYPEAEQKRVGYLTVLGAGKSTPLTVSWHEPRGRAAARRIVYGATSLAIPASVAGY